MPDVPTNTSPNGDAPASVMDDEAFLAAARERLSAARARRDKIAAQIAEATETVKRWEKVVRDLDPEPAPASKKQTTTTVRPIPSKVGPERLERIIAAIRDLAGPDRENEFRQVDVRRALNDEVTSGVTTLAFRQLRDEEVIRFTRKDGINQYFRLTRRAVADQ